MKVNIAVCGRFHYHNYLKHLAGQDCFGKFYYSYKRNYDFGVERGCLENLWLKEHLMVAHTKVFGDAAFEFFLPLYHQIWERGVLDRWVIPDVAHVLLHGTALRLLKSCQASGVRVIGEAVNAHCDVVGRILAAEHERLGMRYQGFDKIMGRMKVEYDHSRHILVPSSWVANSFIESGFNPERLIKLPYPSGTVAHERGERKKVNAGRKVQVLCVAGIHVRKGQCYLMEAVKYLNKQNNQLKFEVTLVGAANEDYISRLRQIGEPFNHISHVANENMVNFMSAFDVFVLPSIEDGFGIVVSEALAAGIPVVTTRNTGAADAIVDGRNGFVVPAQNSIALAHAIADAVDVTPEPGFVASGQIRDWPTYAEKLVSVYHECFAQL